MTENVERFVLDSYALFAHLEDEAGAERVRAVLTAVVRGRACADLSIITLGTVLTGDPEYAAARKLVTIEWLAR